MKPLSPKEEREQMFVRWMIKRKSKRLFNQHCSPDPHNNPDRQGLVSVYFHLSKEETDSESGPELKPSQHSPFPCYTYGLWVGPGGG